MSHPQPDPTTESHGPLIAVAGEALIDLTQRTGDPAYTAYAGGGPCTTAVGLGRLGVPTLFVGTISSDHFGQQLRGHLTDAGVALTPETPVDVPTTLAIATLDEDGAAHYAFYMDGTSAAQLHPGRMRELPQSVAALHVGTLGLVLEPTATSLVATVVERSDDLVIALDPNIRPAVITDMEAHLVRLSTVIRRADIVRLSDDDARLMYPHLSPEDAVARLAAEGVSLVVLSRGGHPILVHHAHHRIEVPVPEVTVVDSIGAGDSLNAGLLAWLVEHGRLSKTGVTDLSEQQLRSAVAYAATVAGLTVSRPGADPPSRDELVSGDR